MKYLLTISFSILFGITLFGQNKTKRNKELKHCAGVKIIQRFQVKDSLITCNTCNWDVCGNVINFNSDTLYKNKGVVDAVFRAIYLTSDTILLRNRHD